jgi:5'-3' exonuclease
MNNKFLLIDTSYLTFYRFFAIQVWFKNALKEIDVKHPDFNWLENQEFIEKFKKTFFDSIHKIIKKYKIPYNNVVFALDCPCKNIWRHKYTEKYKAQRRDSRSKEQALECSNIYEMVRNKLVPDFCGEFESQFKLHKNAEADDIIGVLVVNNIVKNREFIIVASDTDYLQLCNSNVKVLDLKMQDIGEKHLGTRLNSEEYLISKILLGDISDNISSCMIKTSFLNSNDILKKKNNTPFTKATKMVVSRILENDIVYKTFKLMFEHNRKEHKKKEINYEEYQSKCSDYTNPYTEKCRFTLNQILIDFKMIPTSIKNEILQIK